MDRRLTTILAADLVGYSRLIATDEEGVIARLMQARAEVVDPEIEKGGGRIIKSMGDGLLVEFSSPVSALKAALSVQRKMAERETGPEDSRLRFRVGINVGDVVADGDDISGDGVNIAARLETLALPGSISLSRSVFEHVHAHVDVEFTELGPQRVKNLPNPIDVWRVETGVAVPQPQPLASRGKASVAVLPFENFSSDEDQDFLADGIVEDVTTELSRFRWLFVISRNSTIAYKGSSKDVRQIAQELDVRYLVEGSVRRAGNRLRVSAQLIEAKSGDHVWASRWDRVLADLFDIQDELTTAIVSGVEPELGAHERRLARRKPTESQTAWQLSQKGYAEFIKFTDEGFDKAEQLFLAAREMDPDFALPYTLEARVCYLRVMSGRASAPEEAIQRGLELAKIAMTTLNRGLALNENNAQLYNVRAITRILGPAPCPAEIISDEEQALKLSPMDLSAAYMHTVTGLAWLIDDIDDSEKRAMNSFRAACRFQNADWYCHFFLGTSLIRASQIDKAARHIQECLRLRPHLNLEAIAEAWPFPFWYEMWPALKAETSEHLTALGVPEK